MSDQSPEYSSIYRPQPPFNETPFDASAFSYASFADRIIQTFGILNEGAVMAIDAPWGHGKTYFGRNLDARLKAEGWKTVYIDAFQHDFVEDPFLMLAGAIKETGEGKSKKKFLKAASAVGKALLPITAKAIAKVATAGAIDVEDMEDLRKAAQDATGDAASKLVENRIAEFDKDKLTIEAFRTQITALAAAVQVDSGHPLVVFVDELDRCRPDFAVRALERVKHFFDVPHLIFVMLINRTQLENAVSGVYGRSINASLYLRKFIHITYQLPLRLRSAEVRETEIGAYPAHLARKIRLGQSRELLTPFVEALSELASTLGLSFRDVERCFTVFVVATLKAKIDPQFMPYLAAFIVIHVAFPEVHDGLAAQSEKSRESLRELLQGAQARGLADYYANSVFSLVTAYFGHRLGDEDAKHWMAFLFRFHLDAPRVFPVLASLFDPRFAR